MDSISAVIFDLDGTILDTEREGKEILGELLAKYGKVLDAEKEDRRFGKMYKESVDGIIDDYELPITADEYPSLTMPLYQENVGVRAGKAAGAKVVAVPSLKNQDEQYPVANCVIRSLLEFQPELWGLPEFQDWIGNALPIEPLHINGLIGDGAPLDGCTMLNIIADSDSNVSIPDQVSGVFIGWAKLGKLELHKVVVSTGWQVSSTISRRLIVSDLLLKKCHLFGRVKNYSKEKVQLLLVGYIRKQYDEKDMTEALRLTEEDDLIAEAALDLAVFSFTNLL